MTRRKTTTIIHTPRRPVDKAQSVEQAIGPALTTCSTCSGWG